jgi:hypothetical protein
MRKGGRLRGWCLRDTRGPVVSHQRLLSLTDRHAEVASYHGVVQGMVTTATYTCPACDRTGACATTVSVLMS